MKQLNSKQNFHYWYIDKDGVIRNGGSINYVLLFFNSISNWYSYFVWSKGSEYFCHHSIKEPRSLYSALIALLVCVCYRCGLISVSSVAMCECLSLYLRSTWQESLTVVNLATIKASSLTPVLDESLSSVTDSYWAFHHFTAADDSSSTRLTPRRPASSC